MKRLPILAAVLVAVVSCVSGTPVSPDDWCTDAPKDTTVGGEPTDTVVACWKVDTLGKPVPR